ncbi:hypothetical protein A3754_04490 [Alcanivorax sp. HI0083]|nr:hypothetical protein A3730_03060 [Alcanivorax sp. HI0044]KZZ30348.1 hypothetical protein A3754_04490 [Alcanivorax sp. HI0083]PHR65065.1 MAG: hypothetical protein COA55_12010 [Alcanivorax sp.]
MGLAGCNGGEDFSDATIPGCPAGAGCQPNTRGEVLVELVGPRVHNLGYSCTGSNVVYFTNQDEEQSVSSTGAQVTIPAFNALCPAGTSGVEFLVGDALFEGHYISLGELVFPADALAESYTVTVSDLVISPRREAATVSAQVRNVAAFIQGLDTDSANEAFVNIPNEAHDVAEALVEQAVGDSNVSTDTALQETFELEDYNDFLAAWGNGAEGNGYFAEVNDAVAGGVAQLNPSSAIPLANVLEADRYSFAGNYRFDTCRSQISLLFCDQLPDSIVGIDLRFPDGTIVDGQEVTAEPPLILPNGRVLGLGKAVKTQGEGEDLETLTTLVAFSQNATVDETLQLDGEVLSVEAGADVQISFKGRFLNKRIYSAFLPDRAEDDTKNDIQRDYPSLSPDLQEAEKGEATGRLLGGDDVELPLTSEVLTVPQVVPDQAYINDLSAAGPFTVRLMRACLQEDIDEAGSTCRPIDNEEFEIGDSASENYPTEILVPVEEEMPRVASDVDNTTEFCVAVVSDAGNPDNGLVTAGPLGNCDQWDVGFVSRTLEDPDNSNRSANLTLLLAPGAENSGAANFGVTILGRVDMNDACYPLYRTGGPNDSTGFDNKVRAAWVDDFYPVIQSKEWREALAEGETLSDDQQAFLFSIGRGAVQFFAGAPGGGCDPLVP